MKEEIQRLHNRAATHALNARAWLVRGRCQKGQGDYVGAVFSAGAMNESWLWAEEESDKAATNERSHGSVFPGVPS